MAYSALQLPIAVESSPFGKFQPYEGVWDSTVLLWDAGMAGLESVPANAAVLPNLMRDRASAVTGLSAAQCDLTVSKSMDNGYAVGEITEKGAIHVASTQSGAQDAASYLSIEYPLAFANWLLANTGGDGADHAVMVTIWGVYSRLTTSASPAGLSCLSSNLAGTTNRLYYDRGGWAVQITSPVIANQDVRYTPQDVPWCLNYVPSAWNGTKPANMNLSTQRLLAAFGVTGSGPYNEAASFVIYRAQVDLIDLSEEAGDRAAKATTMRAALNALHARDFGEGGRFHGDVYTPADTLKP